MRTPLLKSFHATDRSALRAALVELARELLPAPSLQDERSDQRKTYVDAHVLAELRSKLLELIHAKEGQLTSQQRAEAIDLVSESLSASVIHGRGSEVRARLGQKGLLSRTQYRIEFSESFRESSEKLGVRRSHVERLVRSPEAAVQHIQLRAATDSESFSLFAKTFSDGSGTGTYTLLAISRRKGDVQYISDVFRIYHEDVPIKPGSRPLDLLRAFIERYGCDIQVGGSPRGKFVVDQVFPVVENEIPIGLVGGGPAGAHLSLSAIVRISPLGVIEVALAYGVDISRYRDSLVRHGVHVS